jgi:hypothetical protein
VPLIPHQGPVQQLAAAAADPPFHDRIHPRRLNRSTDHPGASVTEDLIERGGEASDVPERSRPRFSGHLSALPGPLWPDGTPCIVPVSEAAPGDQAPPDTAGQAEQEYQYRCRRCAGNGDPSLQLHELERRSGRRDRLVNLQLTPLAAVLTSVAWLRSGRRGRRFNRATQTT